MARRRERTSGAGDDGKGGLPRCYDCEDLLAPPAPPAEPMDVPEVPPPTDAEIAEAGVVLREAYAKVVRRATANELRAIGALLVPAFKASIVPAAIAAVIAFAVGFLVNIYTMAVEYDGFNVPPGGIATGRGNTFWGSAFWLVASTIAGTVFGFWFRAGNERFWQQVRDLPARVRQLLRLDPGRGLPDVLWGVAGSMLLSLVLPPSMAGIAGVGAVVVVATALRRVVAAMIMVVWQWFASKVANAPIQRPQSFEVVLLGTVIGLLSAYLLSDPDLRLVVALLCAGVAFAIRKGLIGVGRGAGSAPAAVSLALLLAGVAVVVLALAEPALADDGGYAECGQPGWLSWLTSCGGSKTVLFRSLIGGLLSTAGPIIGVPFGSAIAEMVDDYLGPGEEDDPWPWEDDSASGGCDGQSPTQGTGRSDVADYLRRHPNAPPDDSWLIGRMARELNKDYQSGGMGTRLSTMTSETPRAIFEIMMDNTMKSGKSLYDTGEYFRTGRAEADIQRFFDRPSNEVNRDVANMLISFQEGNDPLSRSVRQSFDQMGMDLAKFRDDYSSAVARNDNVALGKLHAKANAHVSIAVASTLGPESMMKNGVGLTQLPFKGAGSRLSGMLGRGGVSTATREGGEMIHLDLDFSDGGRIAPASGPGTGPMLRSRQEIEAMMEQGLRAAPDDGMVRIRLTPEEAEGFNIDRNTSLNLYETSLRDGTFVHMKPGEESGPAVRAATPDGVYKPNSMGAKSLTPEEARALGISDDRAGHIYHYTPETLPDPSDPSFAKMQFRQQNADALNAEIQRLKTEGAYGIDDMGNKYHYRVDVEPDGRIVMVEKNGQPVANRPFIIDEDTADWGVHGPRRIELVDENGLPLFDANGQRIVQEYGGNAKGYRIPMKDAAGKEMVDARGRPIYHETIPDDVMQEWIYRQSNGRIAGEGRTRAWNIDPNDPKYAGNYEKYLLDVAKKESTLAKLEAEGHVLIDGDGIFFCKKKKKGK
jgi:hypothetical protein